MNVIFDIYCMEFVGLRHTVWAFEKEILIIYVYILLLNKIKLKFSGNALSRLDIFIWVRVAE